jgi:large subunit ribosomal protein L4
VSSLVTGDAPSTKGAAATLAKVSTARNVLVVAQRTDELTWKSLRNVETVHLISPGQLNTYDVLVSDDVVFTQAALQSFLDRTGPDDFVFEVAEPEVVAAVVVEEPVAKAPAKKAAAKKAAAKPAETTDAAETSDAAEVTEEGEQA